MQSIPVADIANQLVTFAANLPTWAWVVMLLFAAVGVVWLVVDVVSFLFVTVGITVLTVAGFTVGAPYIAQAWHTVSPYVPQKVTDAGAELGEAAEKTVQQAPVVPPVKPHPGTNP